LVRAVINLLAADLGTTFVLQAAAARAGAKACVTGTEGGAILGRVVTRPAADPPDGGKACCTGTVGWASQLAVLLGPGGVETAAGAGAPLFDDFLKVKSGSS